MNRTFIDIPFVKGVRPESGAVKKRETELEMSLLAISV
jgi:hypothetical protein